MQHTEGHIYKACIQVLDSGGEYACPLLAVTPLSSIISSPYFYMCIYMHVVNLSLCSQAFGCCEYHVAQNSLLVCTNLDFAGFYIAMDYLHPRNSFTTYMPSDIE